MSNANDPDTRRIVENLGPLLLDTVDQHRALVRGTPLESWIRDSKMNFVYGSLADFEKDAYSWEMKARHGLTPQVINGANDQEEEPILGPKMGCIAQLNGWGHITDPGAYVTRLAALFSAKGGRIVEAAVQDFSFENGRISQVHADGISFPCDKAVLTAGIWSKDLMKRLGLKVPMQTERGYHIVYENPSQLPNNPMLMADGKFGVNPMDMGLRFSGTVELGDHHTKASKSPLRAIQYHVKRAFPELTCSSTTEWMGFRPTLPDSTPMIGEIGMSGVFTGFGHQHVGLTGGPKTGRLISELIRGTTPNIDMAAYAPDRVS